jgi:hypothetical protein
MSVSRLSALCDRAVVFVLDSDDRTEGRHEPFECDVQATQGRGYSLLTGASDKGTWVRLLRPPVEGRLARGFEGLDVGHRLSVQRVRTNVARGYVDFERQGVQ